MTKILVTGGAGYIGSHTVLFLRKHGFDVTVVDNLSRGHAHNVEGVPYCHLDLGDTAGLAAILRQGFAAVVHFAAYISVGESTQNPELYFQNNVGGTLSLLSAMREAQVRRLVFSSTAAVYGMPRVAPIPESLAIDPVNPYGESKVIVERMLRWLDEYSGLRSICLRYFNACGAEPGSGLGEEHDPETHLIPLLFRAVKSGKPVKIFGADYPTPDGTCIRDYIHVSDLAEAHVAALGWLLEGGASTQFNVGTGQGASVLEVIAAVEAVTGKRVPYEVAPRRAGDPAALVADSSRLQAQLGWRPRYVDLQKTVATAWNFEERR